MKKSSVAAVVAVAVVTVLALVPAQASPALAVVSGTVTASGNGVPGPGQPATSGTYVFNTLLIRGAGRDGASKTVNAQYNCNASGTRKGNFFVDAFTGSFSCNRQSGTGPTPVSGKFKGTRVVNVVQFTTGTIKWAGVDQLRCTLNFTATDTTPTNGIKTANVTGVCVMTG